MRTLLVAAAFLLATTMGAHADSGSGAQVSADFSGAVGDSVAKGTAIAAVSVGVPVALAGMSAYEAGGSMMAAGLGTIGGRTKGHRNLPIAAETVVGTPAPDQALKARLKEEEL
jgi:hypothetical protein